MFYLSLFLKILIKNPVKAFAFTVSGVGLSLMLGQASRVQKNLLSSFPKLSEEPHFIALVDNKINSESIRRKLMDLPGVQSVRNIASQKIQNQVKNILGDVGEGLEKEIESPLVSGLKIFFSTNLETRSQKLIKKYVVRLTGNDKVTIGPTIGGEGEAQKWVGAFKDSLKMKVGSLVVIISVLLYIMFGYSITKEIIKEGYLVGRFSRRNNVILATTILGFLAMTLLMSTPSLIFGNTSYIGLAVFFIISSLFSVFAWGRGQWTAE